MNAQTLEPTAQTGFPAAAYCADTGVGALVRRAARPDGCSRGRREAFNRLVARFQDRAFALALARLGDRQLAEDAAQEAFLVAWRELPNLREPDAFPGWLARLVQTQCSRLTRNKRLPCVSFELIGETPAQTRNAPSTPEADLLRREQEALVRTALAALPAREREATLLYYLHGHSQTEVAAFLGVPATTIKKRVYSARQRLRKRMAAYMNGDDNNEVVPLTPSAASSASVDNNVNQAVQSANINRPSHQPDFVRVVGLRTATENNEVAEVRRLLSQDAGLARWHDANGDTLLHTAARLGYEAVVSALLDFGADPNARNAENRTPLHVLAAGPALPAIAARLLGAGADATARDAQHDTPLAVAARRAVPLAEDTGDGWALCELLVARTVPDLLSAVTLDRTGEISALVEADPAALHRPDACGDPDAGSDMPLHRAARGGWRKTVKALLDAGADPNAQNAAGWTPLHIALQPRRSRCLPPHTGVATLLRERGATYDLWAAALAGDVPRLRELCHTDPGLVHARNVVGETPLQVAARQNHLPAIELLLALGADVQARDANGHGVLSVNNAAVTSDVADRLLAAGATLDLHAALVLNRPDTIEQLLRADPSLATADLLTWAIEHGCARSAVDVLLRSGVPVHLHEAAALGFTDALLPELALNPDAVAWRDTSGNTPLHRAAEYGHLETTKRLLNAKASVHALAFDGATPLHRAVQNRQEAVAFLLLESGADPNTADFRARTALHLAAASVHYRLFVELLAHGADPNAFAAGNETPLHVAALHGSIDAASALLGAGANPNACNYWQGTPLHIAAREGHAEVVRLLLEKGAEATARDGWRRTALHTAAWFGKVEAVRVLLDAGVSVTELSYGYSTPLHTAAEAGHAAVCTLLVERGANLNAQSDFGRAPLHDAVHGGHEDAVAVLLRLGANPNLQNNRGMTALHWAAAAGKAELASLLLAAGANPALVSHKNETPRDIALRHNHSAVVALLPIPTGRG